MIIKDIHILIAIGIIIVTVAGAVFGTIKFAIPNLKDNLGKLSRRLKELEDKVPNLVKAQEFERVTIRLDENCKTHRTHCQALVCGRIDDVRGDLKAMDTKRERARSTRTTAWDTFKSEIVPRAEFNEHKTEMKSEVHSIGVKIDAQGLLLARLDERIAQLVKVNGASRVNP